MTMHQHVPKASRPARVMTIQQALEWAFATEKAQLDFDEYGSREFERVAVDPIWVMARRAELGCKVDGGGSSSPATDAQIIAAVVEGLPENLGGRRMATQIAELARARRVPDWEPAVKPGVAPASWAWCDQEGRWTATVRPKAGSPWCWRSRQRKRRERRGDVCPIIYTGTAASVAAQHRAYLAWWAALLELWHQLRGALHSIEISDDMPPMAPWRDGE